MASSRAGAASKPTGPQRTCAGCRAVADRAELLRVVAVERVATPDPERRLAGRGANVHPSGECVALAIRRKSLQRALRVPGLDTGDLVAWIQSHGDWPPAPPGPTPSREFGSKWNERPMNAQP